MKKKFFTNLWLTFHSWSPFGILDFLVFAIMLSSIIVVK
jgi:hypothetical protein